MNISMTHYLGIGLNLMTLVFNDISINILNVSLLEAKGNQRTLKKEIEDYVQDEGSQKEMDVCCTKEKNRDRIETRTAYTTADIDWLYGRYDWENLCCIGAIHTEFETKSVKTSEWHYYICSRPLTAKELLIHARLEWSVESNVIKLDLWKIPIRVV